MFLTVLLVIACSKEDGGELQPSDNEPQPVAKQGAPFQIVVLFAPGQLGDKGYADNVMEGLNTIDDIDDNLGGDSLDIRFVAPRNMEDVRKHFSSIDLYSSDDYERRLLVLTEPYMDYWLSYIRDELKPTDEVLMLKMNEEDIAQVAQQYSLGSRIHGLNISVAEPARRFCQYIHRWIEDTESPVPRVIQIPVFRLYENTAYPYRDGMMEAIQEEMGDVVQFVHIGLSSLADAGIYMEGSTQTMVEAAYEAAQIAQDVAESSGCPFVLVDLGAGNTGWDYYLLSQAFTGSGPLRTLMLDAQMVSRLNRNFISREFGTAFHEWVTDWMMRPVGAMDAQVTHEDEYYYRDNIYELEW